MYSLPQQIRSELYKRFDFTQELTNDAALFHPMESGRFLICLPPPYRAGVSEVLINKAFKCKAELVVLVLPCDTSTDWFHKVWEESRNNPDSVKVDFFNGRVKWESDEPGQSRFKGRVATVIIEIRNGRNERASKVS